MRKSPNIFFLFLLLVAPFANRAQNNREPVQVAPSEEQMRRFREAVMKPVVYRVEGMDKVKVVRNLDYARSGSEFRKMDVYQPPDPARTEKRPAVIFIHGGASERFTPKDWGVYTSWGRLMAASGLVAVTFTHRLSFPRTQLEDGMSDVNAAIDYVRSEADTLNIDKDRLALIVFSAGGPMLSQTLSEKPAYIRCIAAYYAFMDVRQSQFHRDSETPENVKKFSNITYLDLPGTDKIPPILVTRAGRDEIPTMNDSIDRFVASAFAKNLGITVVNHPTGVHSFDNTTDDDRSREIVAQTIAFMKLHLGSKK